MIDITLWIGKLRSAPLESRKRWLAVSTIICMIAVLYIWLAYFNSLVVPVENSTVDIKAERSFSLWQSVEGIAGMIGEKMINKASVVGAVFGGRKNFVVNPPN